MSQLKVYGYRITYVFDFKLDVWVTEFVSRHLNREHNAYDRQAVPN